jgi:hypothetical protein
LGWDLPLDDPDAFVRVVEDLAAVSAGDRAQRRRQVQQNARRLLAQSTAVADMRRLFSDAIGSAGPQSRLKS